MTLLLEWLIQFPGAWLLPLAVGASYGMTWALDDRNARDREKPARLPDDWRVDV